MKKNLHPTNELSLLFIPSEDINCLVNYIRSMIEDNIIPLLPPGTRSHIIDMLFADKNTVPLNPRRLMLTAHAHNDENGFHNGNKPNIPITYDWWIDNHDHLIVSNLDMPKYEFLFANACLGFTILKNYGWDRTFPHFIGFDHIVQMYEDSESQKVWEELYNKIILELINFNPQTIYNRIIKAFNSVIRNVKKKIASGAFEDINNADANLSYIIECKNHCRTSM